MKNEQVKIGKYYVANVSGKRVIVKIVSEHNVSGWYGKNILTGREVRVKSGRRLFREVEKDSEVYRFFTEKNKE